MLMPSQYAEKLPATKPERMLSDAPPSSEDVTTSFTWAELIKVKTLTNSGMMAPASVPQEMIDASFHHSVASPLSVGIINLDTMKVRMMDTTDVSQTRDVSGVSKFMWSELENRALAMASLMKYEPALETSIMIRITKIHTSSCTCTTGSRTAARMKAIRATPVTP